MVCPSGRLFRFRYKSTLVGHFPDEPKTRRFGFLCQKQRFFLEIASHQKFQVLYLLRLFWGWGFPYISRIRIHTAYVGGDSSISDTTEIFGELKKSVLGDYTAIRAPTNCNFEKFLATLNPTNHPSVIFIGYNLIIQE